MIRKSPTTSARTGVTRRAVSAGIGAISGIDAEAPAVSYSAELPQELAFAASNLQSLLARRLASVGDLGR